MTWRASQIWKGEAAFIIGGGPSLSSCDLSLLAGRRVIVINSSYLAYPAADFLVWSDMRWWIEHRVALKDFKGKIIATASAASGPPDLCRMLRNNGPGLSADPGTLMVRNTTLTAAINLAVHLGVAKIVLLGIDQKKSADGRTHHHAPHKWPTMSNAFQRQQLDLPRVAEDLKRLNVECVNASPGTALTLWPLVRLEDHVTAEAVAA